MMAGFVAGLAVLVSTGVFQTGSWEQLGEITAYGQTDPDSRMRSAVKVPIKFPTHTIAGPPEDAPFIDWDGWRYEINEWGNIGRRWKGAGGYTEFKQLYDEAQKRIATGRTNKWKVKCVIFRRTNVLYKDATNVLESQRAYLNATDEQFCLETFARFKAVVEAYSQGAIQLELTFSVEDQPITGTYEKDDVWTLDPRDAGERYLRGRFNRGDFDSVIYMFHPGNTRSFSFGGTAGRINNATASYVILSNGRELDTRIGHTEAMVHEFLHQIEESWTTWGYGTHTFGQLPELHGAELNGYRTDVAGNSGWFSWMRDLMMSTVTQGMWAKLSNRNDPDWDLATARCHASNNSKYVWQDVKDDPWEKLPYLTPDNLAQWSGISKISIETNGPAMLFKPQENAGQSGMLTSIDPDDFQFNNELNFAREAMARFPFGNSEFLFVRWDAADFVLSNLPNQGAIVRGYLSISSKLVVVCELPKLSPTSCEINALALGSGNVKTIVNGAGDFQPTETPKVSFSSTGADVRYTLAHWDGTVAKIGDSGEVEFPQGQNGVKVYRLTAVSPDGSRSERPLIVRRFSPVRMDFNPVGSSLFSGNSIEFSLELANNSSAREVQLNFVLPSGWTIEGAPKTVSMAAREQKKLSATVRVPANAPDGASAIGAELSLQSGHTFVSRAVVVKTTAQTLLYEDFENGVGAWGAPRDDSGGWKAEQVDGGHQGKCLMITDCGGSRWGRINIFGDRDENGKPKQNGRSYRVSDFPFFDFYLKSESKNNLGIVAKLASGKRVVMMLIGPYLEQWGESTQLPRAKFVPNGTWQHVVTNFGEALKAAVGDEQQYVTDLSIGDTRTFSSNQSQDADRHSYFLDEFKIARTGDVSQNDAQNDSDDEIRAGFAPASQDPNDRARAAAQINSKSTASEIAAIRPLLKDRYPKVRLNAARAFTEVKDAAAAAILAESLKSESDETVMEMMVRALAFQDTPEGWKAISEAPKSVRSDEQGVQECFRQLAKKGIEGYVRDITGAITSQSWISRVGGARALGSLPFESAKLDLMAFLFEVDPHVRIEVGRWADPNLDLVRRRMEWGSINDLSDVVRAYDYAALTRAKDPVIRSRGYSGLKETNPDIRIIIVDEMAKDPQTYHVEVLLPLLKDKNPDVRAAALSSYVKMPGDKSWQQLAALETESYEQVLIPLLQMIRSGTVKPPAGYVERFVQHRSVQVANLAKEIIGK